jgi:ribonuclease D
VVGVTPDHEGPGATWLDLAGDQQTDRAQAFLIRRYIAWRNRHAQDRVLREVVKRANVA